MGPNLKLSTKALILVVLPLLFTSAFVIILFGLLDQAEREIKEEAHAKAVVETGCELSNFLLNACPITGRQLGNEHTKIERFEKLVVEVPNRFKHLRELLKGSPAQLARLEKIEKKAMQEVAVVSEIKELMKKGDVSVCQCQSRLDTLGKTLSAQMDGLADEFRKIQIALPAVQAHTREAIRIALYVGLIGNMLLASLLALIFHRGTVSRLRVLMDNTRRLAEQKPLNEPLSGTDELGHLDRTFHQMADSLHESQRQKQEFMAMVSHDLRSPLMSVKCTFEMLEDGVFGQLPSRASARVNGANNSVERLIVLINDLLDIEKVEAGKFDLFIRQESVKEIVARSVESVMSLADAKAIEIQQEVTDIQVEADSDRLVQVVVNLLSNAIKFSPNGSSISINALRNGDWLELRIKDQGPGIPEDFRESIFDRFQQAKTGEHGKKGSTGLGLAICKAIIEEHKGNIGVYCEHGNGSTFWFRIPAARVAEPATAAEVH